MVTFLGSGWRTARKEHRCGWCPEPIVAGDRYSYSAGAEDGHAYTWKMHEECDAAFSSAADYSAQWRDHDEPVCCNTDIDGGSHERGKRCPDCEAR
jgi:hypothetical protein